MPPIRPWCDDRTEFEFGPNLILDGLEKHLEKRSQHG